MNSSTTLLGKIIVTSAVEKQEAVELSDNSSYLTYIEFFMTPTVRIKFLVNFSFLAHCVAFGKLVSELQ